MNRRLGCTRFLGVFALLLTWLFIADAQASVLVGVTGDGGSPSETLFVIDQTDASATELMPLGNGTDGETIAYNPNDQLLYHGSGNAGSENVVLESVNLRTGEINNIDISTSSIVLSETHALTYWPEFDRLLLGMLNSRLYTVNFDGSRFFEGFIDIDAKGLAFVGDTLYAAKRRSTVFGSNPELFEIDPGLPGLGSPPSIVSHVPVVHEDPLKEITVLTGLATNPETNELWAAAGLRLIDPDTGESSGQDGREIIIIDPTTGLARSVGNSGLNLAGLAFVDESALVPEPSSVVLVLLGLCGMFTFQRRRASM